LRRAAADPFGYIAAANVPRTAKRADRRFGDLASRPSQVSHIRSAAAVIVMKRTNAEDMSERDWPAHRFEEQPRHLRAVAYGCSVR
jgi:hypothetical protein